MGCSITSDKVIYWLDELVAELGYPALLPHDSGPQVDFSGRWPTGPAFLGT